MKHWTLTALRMMARSGLLVMVLCWIAGFYGPAVATIRRGPMLAAIQCDSATLSVQFFRNQICLHRELEPKRADRLPSRLQQTIPVIVVGESMERYYDEGFEPGVPMTASTVSLHAPGIDAVCGAEAMILKASYWLLCSAFLIATIATSVRWKKQGDVTERHN